MARRSPRCKINTDDRGTHVTGVLLWLPGARELSRAASLCRVIGSSVWYPDDPADFKSSRFVVVNLSTCQSVNCAAKKTHHAGLNILSVKGGCTFCPAV